MAKKDSVEKQLKAIAGDGSDKRAAGVAAQMLANMKANQAASKKK